MPAAVSVPDGLFDPSCPVSLYVHVPFCTSKCDYCAFYSLPSACWKGGAFLPRYVDRIVEEISACTERLGRPYETVFFGGGNPGCLPVDALFRMLEAADRFGRSKECTVEMNPESLSDAHFPLFERHVDRLSMGVQSLSPATLKTLGRNASLEQVHGGVEKALRLHELYGTRLSFDLMTCIPGQTLESALSDIDALSRLASPEHISLYCLTLEEGTPLYTRLRSEDDDWQSRLLAGCWEKLASLGYEHYEVSNFARPDAQSLHNSRYWALSQYIGLGPAAAGTAFSPEGVVRWECPPDIDSYCLGAPFSDYLREDLSRAQEVEEYLLVALRVKEGIDKSVFLDRFGFGFERLTTPRFRSVVDSGLYSDTSKSFSCTEKGWMLMDDIVLQLALEADGVDGS